MEKKNNGNVTLYLMRHGETILNKAGRTQGWSDGVLTKEGTETAINAAIGLSNINFKAIYSSDLGRAVKTAELVIKENNSSKDLKLIKTEALREAYFGKYEGGFDSEFYRDILDYLKVSSFEEAMKKYDDMQKEFCNAAATLDDTTEAENYETVYNRYINFINKVTIETSKKGGGNILLVTHGGVMRILLDKFNKNNIDMSNIDNCSISIVKYSKGEYIVESINNVDHIEKGQDIRMI